MTPEKAAELTTQIVVAVIQSNKLTKCSEGEIASFYCAIYKQVIAGSELTVNASNNPLANVSE